MNFLFHLIHGLDVSVYQFLNVFAGNRLIDRLANYEEGDNLFKGGLFLAMYAYVWFHAGPRQDERRRSIIAVLAGTLLALALTRTIANIAPYRLRPMYDPTLLHHAYSFPISFNMVEWSSFPSDTAAYFTALAFGLVRLIRRPYSLAILLFAAVWICLPRLFFGLHFLSDVVVGIAIGIAVVEASLQSRWLQQDLASPILSFLNAKPHVFYAASFMVFFEMGVAFDDVRRPVRALFHALQTEHFRQLAHFRELFHVMANFGLLAVTVAFVAVMILARNRAHGMRTVNKAAPTVEEHLAF
jgi:membrane-associated phospholipid phosphatase